MWTAFCLSLSLRFFFIFFLCIKKGYRLDRQRIIVLFPAGTRALTFLQSNQTGSGAHPASVVVGRGKLII